ncbi:hypothetical protein GCM10028805_27230 [Spirosoma harenae]
MSQEHDKDTDYIVVDIPDGSFDPEQHRQSTIADSHQRTTNSQQLKQQSKEQQLEAFRHQALEVMMDIEESVADLATKAVVWSSPLITREEIGIIGRGTISIVQGAFGSHKSRLAEQLAALMLTTGNDDDSKFLGFKRAMLERFCVCYIDTERNLTEELPYAIQGIKSKAGYKLEDKPANFRFTSVKSVDRSRRFDAIEAFIGHARDQTNLHLFVLIDVVTDAIGDFNDPKESMRLFDFLGNLCDRHNATFLLVIHQNPGTDKARGHTGTEAVNKASTVLQIGIEKTEKGEDSELIKLKYLKLRRSKRPEPVFLQFSDEANGLVLASSDAVITHNNYRTHKAAVEDIAERLESLLSEGPVQKGEVVMVLMKEFNASDRTIRNRLKELIDQQPEMFDNAGRLARLYGYSEGKNEYYRFEPLK